MVNPAAIPTLQQKLLMLLVPGVFLLVGAYAALVLLLNTSSSRELMQQNASQLARSFGQQSVLALLTASTENAEPVLTQIRAFPDVTAAGLWSLDRQMLIWHGDNQLAAPFHQQLSQGALPDDWLWQDTQYWYLASPVTVQHDQNDELSLNDSGPQLLGYALLVYNKQRLQQHSRTLVLLSLLVLSVAIVSLFWLIRSWLQKVVQPLHQLSEQMQNFSPAAPALPSTQGGREIVAIDQAYRQMLATLAQRDAALQEHQQTLETLVQIRTRELIAARDAALTASRHKSEFLANISHELRTPIQSIMGYIDLVAEQLEYSEFAPLTDDLQRSQRNAERLLQMINSLLDVAKIEAGRLELHLVPVRCSALISQSTELIRPLLADNQLQLELPEPDVMLEVDEEKLVQVLVNLLSNACKFTHAGQIKLTVQPAPPHCQFIVTDSGIGIDHGALSQIFQPFYQVDGSQSRHSGGTGLGLAISKQFVELMQGSISVKSQLGHGTEFVVTVPLSAEKPE